MRELVDRIDIFVGEGKTIFGNKEAEYIIRERKPGSFEVTKWTRGVSPTGVYRCSKIKNTWKCDCPARGTCKHVRAVKDWIKKGKKPYLDTEDFEKHMKKIGVKL